MFSVVPGTVPFSGTIEVSKTGFYLNGLWYVAGENNLRRYSSTFLWLE